MELRGYPGDAYGSGSLENLLAVGVNNTSTHTLSTLEYLKSVLGETSTH